MSTSAILSKIQKLLNLAADKTNANESAAAYAAAQKLLTEHQLSVADLSGAEVKVEEVTAHTQNPLYVGKRCINWRFMLALGVAECNSCSAYWDHNRHGRTLNLIGKKSDMEIVSYFYHSIAQQIDSMCKEVMLIYSSGKKGAKTFSNNFRIAAVNTVIERMKEARKEVRQSYQGTAALVKVDQTAAEVALYGKNVLKLTYGPKYQIGLDKTARELGREAGKKVSLSKGLGTSSAKQLK